MKKYSRIYKVNSKRFRYNYEQHVLEWVSKPTPEDEQDNQEWMEKFGEPLFDIQDGYAVIDYIGLGVDNWKESPRYWCEQYAFELDEEIHYEMMYI